MTYNLHMNGIITGSLNAFCLTCEIFLKSQQEANEHVETPDHKDKLTAVPYSDKFKDEHIRKFKGGYYCEFCNILLPIASKINLHVTEEDHKQNKGVLLLKPQDSDVVAFNNVLIEEGAWHGLIDGVCSLCNAEFDEDDDHKATASHSLNLVLKAIQFGTDNAIYRHLDDTAVQCLTCNKLLAPNRMTEHFGDKEHHELYTKRRTVTNGAAPEIEPKDLKEIKVIPPKAQKDNDIKKIGKTKDGEVKETNGPSVEEKDKEIETQKVDNNDNKNKISPTENKSKILESIIKYQIKGININLETETAFCKKCSQVITFDFIKIETHIESHSSETKVDSDLLYPSNPDPNLNRVNINDKTTSSNKKDGTERAMDLLKEALQVKKDMDAQSMEKERKINEMFDSSSDDTEDEDDLPDVPEVFPPLDKNDEKTSQEEEVKEFAKANKITYNGGPNQSYCRICEVHVPASFKSMKEHAGGSNHKKNIAATKAQLPNPGWGSKELTREFIDSAYDVEGIFYQASIVNEEYCVPRESFYLISENNSRLRCIICEIFLPPYSSFEDHVKTRQHNQKLLSVAFITSEKNEFIREVHPGLYHCGYCNLVISGWTDMKSHLKCSDHKESRSTGEIRLRRHMPGLQRHKMRQQLEAMSLMRLFNMF